jgi:hypothetical protein
MTPRIDPNEAPMTANGIDIGKEIFHAVGIGADGKLAFRLKIKGFGQKRTCPLCARSGHHSANGTLDGHQVKI